VEYGIQRRTIYLIPPSEEDLAWMFDHFDAEDVWQMFGFLEPAKAEMIARYEKGNVVVGIIRRVDTKKRIGFSICFPPIAFLSQWEFGIVIPDPLERDAFSAIYASDAMTHYMFDHLRITDGMWRIRADNAQSNALARRMGYKPFGVWKVGEHRFNFFRMTTDIWTARREKLERGEEKSPSGLGAAFLTLCDPPFDPEPLPTSSSAPKAAAEREA
jgi:RimJ/RimL family protein N-acetyltransferase